MKFVEVILTKRVRGFENGVIYSVPDGTQVNAGQFCKVPFQKRSMLAVVHRLITSDDLTFDAAKVKPVETVNESGLLTAQAMAIVLFISRYYRCSLHRALRLFLPKQSSESALQPPCKSAYRLLDDPPALRGQRQVEIIESLKLDQFTSLLHLKRHLPAFSSTALKALVKKGIVEEQLQPVYQPFNTSLFKPPAFRFDLTDQQTKALAEIQASTRPVLLHGVTGSGKTELYLRLLSKLVEQGKQALLLVPEIALTPQMVNYFKAHFGDAIALFHSGLSDAERTKSWWKVYTGHAPIVIGSRSAIFAPFQNLGAIVVDEEHEWTYKQESTPYYQTRAVAEQLCELWNAKLVLASATPSVESYAKSQNDIYAYVQMPERISSHPMPSIEVVDLRDEFKKRNFSIFSLRLQAEVKQALVENEQVILFVNQRGLANAVTCRDCGHTETCPHCEISLKFHRYYQSSGESLVCHYCHFVKAPEINCPTCSSVYIKHIGVGTQRVEEEVQQLFPEAKVVRADKDTTQSREGFQQIYNDFAARKYNVLIGTQMIAKGLDFPDVSVIGIVLADVGMHIPDFRSNERLFQLITQVSGRCGRADKQGRVVLQTYNPDHPTIQRAATYDYQNFIDGELILREKLGYPPFNRMIKFTVVGDNQKHLDEHIQAEQEVIEDIFRTNDLPIKIRTAPAMIPKMSNRYYHHVLIQSKNPDVLFKHWQPPRGWRVDVDPIHTT